MFIVAIHDQAEVELPEIVQALGAFGPLLGHRQRRQQQRRQNPNDRDDHQQLNQGERPPGFHV